MSASPPPSKKSKFDWRGFLYQCRAEDDARPYPELDGSTQTERAPQQAQVAPCPTSSTSGGPTATTSATGGRSLHSSASLSVPLSSSQENPKNDIANAMAPRLTDEQKEMFLTNPWMPEESDLPTYKLPGRTQEKRTWQMKWLADNKWLTFSKKLGGGLCKYCVVFKPEDHKLEKFYKHAYGTTFNECKKITKKFEGHAQAKGHKDSLELADNFLSVRQGRRPDVVVHGRQAADNQFQERLSYGMRVLHFGSRVMLFLAKQNMPFRGHRNEQIGEESKNGNQGNFLETLKLIAFACKTSGESTEGVPQCEALFLQKHLEKPKFQNAHHCGKNTQNELIEVAGELVQKKLAKDIKEAGVFSVLADETTDVSTKEQLAITIRYWLHDHLHEDTVDMVEAKSTTGEALKDLILEVLEKLDLDPRLMRGLGFDGAANMSGVRNGCAALIQRDFPLALYVHCFAHTLNLVIVDTCEIPEIRNMFSAVQDVCTFIGGSAKRLGSWFESFPQDEKVKKLRAMSTTRWSSRANALAIMRDLLHVVLDALHQIAAQDSKNRDKANSLISKIESFPFLVSLFSAQFILEFTNTISTRLQSKQLDVVGAVWDVDSIKQLVQQYRPERQFEQDIYQKAIDAASSLNVPETVPRLALRQQNRANAPAQVPSQHYYRNLWLPFVDHFLGQLTTRFTPHNQKAMLAQFLVPSHMCLDGSNPLSFHKLLGTPDTSAKSLLKAVEPLLDMYSDTVDKISVENELIRWKALWQSRQDRPGNLPSSLLQCPRVQFPNVHKLLKILVVLPVSTAECERTFSTLRRLKTYLRSTMNQERLAGLMLMNIHLNKSNPISLSSTEVVEAYLGKGVRRGLI